MWLPDAAQTRVRWRASAYDFERIRPQADPSSCAMRDGMGAPTLRP
jgi:hypothetical protein